LHISGGSKCIRIEATLLSGISSRLGLTGEEPPSLSKAKLDEPAPIKKARKSKKRNKKIP
jgi:hypothetical protein